MSWSRVFDDEIIVPRRQVLKTLRDAGEFVARRPKASRLKTKIVE